MSFPAIHVLIFAFTSRSINGNPVPDNDVHFHINMNSKGSGRIPANRTRQVNEKGSDYADSDCPVDNSTYVTGNVGDQCTGTSGCFEGFAECAIEDWRTPGVCKKMPCESEEDCAKQTILPMNCWSNFCYRKDCEKLDDCPEGFGCDAGRGRGWCRRSHGTCDEFDCECTSCGDAICNMERCLCTDDNDKCSIAIKGPGRRHKRSACKDK